MPEMPEAVKEPTNDGLEATIEYWWESANYLVLTGDAKPMAAVSSEECVTCSSHMENWTGVYADQGWATGYEPSLENVVVDARDTSHGTFIYSLTEGPGMTYRAGGKPIDDPWANERVASSWSGFARFDNNTGRWLIEEQAVQDDPKPVD